MPHSAPLESSGRSPVMMTMMPNAQFNNNLWISVQDRYVWESGYDDGFTPFWGLNLDYDGFDWGSYMYAVKWKGVRYATLADFSAATGLEESGIRIVDLDGDRDVDGADLAALAQTTIGLKELTVASAQRLGT